VASRTLEEYRARLDLDPQVQPHSQGRANRPCSRQRAGPRLCRREPGMAQVLLEALEGLPEETSSAVIAQGRPQALTIPIFDILVCFLAAPSARVEQGR